MREADFKPIRAARLNPAQRHLWNITEGHRAERILGERCPGRRRNLGWLLLRILGRDMGDPRSPEADVLSWILLTARSWLVSRLAELADDLAADLERRFYGPPRTSSPRPGRGDE